MIFIRIQYRTIQFLETTQSFSNKFLSTQSITQSIRQLKLQKEIVIDSKESFEKHR